MATGTAERSAPRPARPEHGRRSGEKPGAGSRFSFEGQMLTPALILLAALSLFPFVYIIVMSLSRVGLIGGISFHWAGLDNWTRLFSDSAVGVELAALDRLLRADRRARDDPRDRDRAVRARAGAGARTSRSR